MQAAAVFALTMFALLWGISFSFSAATTPVFVEQISLVPQVIQPAPKLPPPTKAEKPEPKPEPKPAPSKPAPKPATDADIALKKKQQEEEEKRRKEKERKKREQQKRDEVKKKKEEAERKQREEEAQKRREAEEQQRQEEEARKQQAEEERQQREAEARDREEARRVARETKIGNERQLIKGQIRGRIERAHSHPASVPDDADIEVIIVFRLITIDTGRAELREPPEIIKSSGNAEYDESVWRAIIKTGVFPFPREPELAEEFLDITLHMSPRDK